MPSLNCGLLVILSLLVCNVEMTEAVGMEFGDGLAIVLGLILGCLGILACLGKYARKLTANQY